MSVNDKRQQKGGGDKAKRAEASPTKKSLHERALSTWRGLRTALEVGAAEGSHVASLELINKEKIKVNLSLANPRTLIDEPLTDANVKRFMICLLLMCFYQT